MKLHTITAALAMAGLGFAGATVHAQGISDDVIRVGFITDMSGVYSDIDGKAGLEAVRMAIEDAGGAINGKKIEVVSADHQNKADVASARAREWFDQQKVDVIVAGTNSATSLAMAAVAAEKRKAPQKSLFFKGDSRAAYGAVREAMDALYQAGITDITLGTEEASR